MNRYSELGISSGDNGRNMSERKRYKKIIKNKLYD